MFRTTSGSALSRWLVIFSSVVATRFHSRVGSVQLNQDSAGAASAVKVAAVGVERGTGTEPGRAQCRRSALNHRISIDQSVGRHDDDGDDACRQMTSADTKQRRAGPRCSRSSTDEQTPRFPPPAVCPFSSVTRPLPPAGRRYRVGRTRKPGPTSDLQPVGPTAAATPVRLGLSVDARRDGRRRPPFDVRSSFETTLMG